MNSIIRSVIVFACVATIADPSVHADPPFEGTIFIDSDIITPADQTTFQDTSYAGQATRTMFDRRINSFIDINAYLFNTTFTDGLSTEIQINPEFGSPDAALAEARKYGDVIGRLPTALRRDVQTVWIHKGTEPFGGGNHNLLIHTCQSALYEADGILEETLVHEASHTSLDERHASAAGWLAAQTADGEFISTYARDNSTREDIAESFLPYLAIRYRRDRISLSLADAISKTIPNRITYFDNQLLDMYPIAPRPSDINQDGSVDAADAGIMFGNWGSSGNGDLNHDQIIDAADAGQMFADWTGDREVPVSVPEPISTVVGSVLFGCVVGRSLHATPIARRVGPELP